MSQEKQNNPPPSQAVIVLGMHRSGTSLVSSLLAELGVEFGDRLMPPADDNPEGFWEDVDVVSLHEAFFASVGTSWDDPTLLVASVYQDLERHQKNLSDQLVATIGKKFAGAKVWGIKDPRICRLTQVWDGVLSRLDVTPLCVLPFRHPLETIDSLSRRDEMPPGRAAYLWLEHVLAAERWSRGYSRAFCDVSALRRNAVAEMSRVSSQIALGVPDWEVAADSLETRVQPGLLKKTRKTPAALRRTPVLDLCLEVFNLLKRSHKNDVGLDSEFDEVAAKLVAHQTWAPGLTDYLAAERGRLRQENQELRVSLDREAAKVGDLNASHGRKDSVIDELRARLDNTHGMRRSLEGKLEEQQRAREGLKKANDEERIRYFDLVNRLFYEIGIEPPSAKNDLSTEAISELKNRVQVRVRALKSDQDNGARLVAGLERELNRVSDAVSSLLAGDGGSRFGELSVESDAVQRLTEILQPLLALQQRFKQAQAEVDDSIRERDNALKALNNLQVELARHEAEAAKRFDDTATALDSVKQELEAARGSLSDAERREAEATKRSNDTATALDSVKQELEAARGSLSDAERREAEATKRSNDTATALDSVKQELEAARGSLSDAERRALKALRSSQKIEEALTAARGEADTLVRERDQARSEGLALQAKLEKTEAANQTLTHERDEAFSRNAANQLDYKAASALIDDLQAKCEGLAEEVKQRSADAAKIEGRAREKEASAARAFNILKEQERALVLRLAATNDELAQRAADHRSIVEELTTERSSSRAATERLNAVERDRDAAAKQVEALRQSMDREAVLHDLAIKSISIEQREKSAMLLKKLSLAQDSVRLRTEVLTSRDAEILALRSELEMIRRSRSWRASAPLRVLTNLARRARAVLQRSDVAVAPALEAVQPEEARETLQVSVDNLTKKDGRVHLHGWAVDSLHRLASVDLVLVDGVGRKIRLPGEYGTSRKDVANALERPEFELSGFWVSGLAPEYVRDAWLTFRYSDGVRVTSPLPKLHLMTLITVGRRAFSGLRDLVKLGDVPKVLKSVLLGDYRRMSQALKRRRSAIKISDVTSLEHALITPSSTDDPEIGAIRGHLGDRSRDRLVIIDHALGGGANHYARELAAEWIASGGLLLRFDYTPSALTIRACLDDSDGVKFDQTLSGNQALIDTIRAFAPDRVILNNVYTFTDPSGLAADVAALRKELGFRLILPLHDFFPICPSYNLLDSSGLHCGVPEDRKRCEVCIQKHEGEFTSYVSARSIARWREDWGRFLVACDEIMCFSHSSEELILRAYPDLERSKLHYRPHRLEYDPRKPKLAPVEGRIKVGVLGTISTHKGRNVIAELLTLADRVETEFEIVVLGALAPPLEHERLTVHGAYMPTEIPDLIEKYGIHLFLMPSVWPETFSYVTEEIMRLNMPLAVFDIGAPAERVASYSKGVILPEISAKAALAGVIQIVDNQLGDQE